MRTVVKNGTLVLENRVEKGDLLIESERIAAVGGEIPLDGAERVVDATGQYVMPGGLDAHTHMQLVSYPYTTRDDFETGTRAAACGGVTTIIDFITQKPGESLVHSVRGRRVEADGRVCTDYGLHGNVVDISQGQLDELGAMVEMGVPSFKVYSTYKKAGFYTDDYTLLRLLERGTEVGALVQVHCENDAIVEGTKAALVAEGKETCRYHGQSRPGLAEIEAVSRCILLAEATGSPIYIVHNTMPESVRLLTAARAKGVLAIAESCTQYLTLDDSVFESEHPEEFVCSPPVRPREKMLEMRELLAAGEILVIASDHCGYVREQKRSANHLLRAAQGLPGVETSLQVMYSSMVASGKIGIEHLARVFSTNPAKIFGMYPKKGTLKVGSDADVVIYDPRGEHVLSDDDLHGAEGSYTPWAGLTIQGNVEKTIARGRIVWENGTFKGRAGDGRFVPGKPFDPAIVAEL
jgi:dihydropyrimidinase